MLSLVLFAGLCQPVHTCLWVSSQLRSGRYGHLWNSAADSDNILYVSVKNISHERIFPYSQVTLTVRFNELVPLYQNLIFDSGSLGIWGCRILAKNDADFGFVVVGLLHVRI